MTPERAQEIVNGVAERHPKLSQATYPQIRGDIAFIALNDMPVDPRRMHDWFVEAGAYVVQVGYRRTDELWLVYFKEQSK